MNQPRTALDSVVKFLIHHTPKKVLVQIAAQAHEAKVDDAIRQMAAGAIGLLTVAGVEGYDGRTPNPRNQSLIQLYDRFAYLIPREYVNLGVVEAEERMKRPVKYNPLTETVYV